MMQDKDLVDVQKALKNTRCPSCQNKNGISAILRCDLALEECVVAIQCASCALTFELSPEVMEAHHNDKLVHICPECHSQPSKEMKIELDASTLQGQYLPAPCEQCAQAIKPAQKPHLDEAKESRAKKSAA
jgi:RNase P subunit RPR2